jgi:hypothetical protein
VDRLVGAGSNDLGSTLLEHPCASGLVVSSGGLVYAVESELDGHLQSML